MECPTIAHAAPRPFIPLGECPSGGPPLIKRACTVVPCAQATRHTRGGIHHKQTGLLGPGLPGAETFVQHAWILQAGLATAVSLQVLQVARRGWGVPLPLSSSPIPPWQQPSQEGQLTSRIQDPRLSYPTDSALVTRAPCGFKRYGSKTSPGLATRCKAPALASNAARKWRLPVTPSVYTAAAHL